MSVHFSFSCKHAAVCHILGLQHPCVGLKHGVDAHWLPRPSRTG